MSQLSCCVLRSLERSGVPASQLLLAGVGVDCRGLSVNGSAAGNALIFGSNHLGAGDLTSLVSG